MTNQDENSWGARLVDAACSVVGSGIGVPKITVVEIDRLPYDELARLRDRAAASDTDFVMEGDGTVIVKRADHEATRRWLFVPTRWSLFRRTRSAEPTLR
jgi:hypothetical protein